MKKDVVVLAGDHNGHDVLNRKRGTSFDINFCHLCVLIVNDSCLKTNSVQNVYLKRVLKNQKTKKKSGCHCSSVNLSSLPSSSLLQVKPRSEMMITSFAFTFALQEMQEAVLLQILLMPKEDLDDLLHFLCQSPSSSRDSTNLLE